MTLKECYDIFEGDYDSVVGRLSSERLVQKFIIKFLNDKSFNNLKASMENGNMEEAFRAAHTLKGVCQNLSFTKLSDSSSKLTEALRNGGGDNAGDLFLQTQTDYTRTVDAIKSYLTENGL